MQHPSAAAAPKKLTMLFAVVATGAAATAAAIPDDEPPVAVAELEPSEQSGQPEQLRAPPPAPVGRVDRPLVLRTGAPACGNTMSKAGRPMGCRPLRPGLHKLKLDVKVQVRAGTPEGQVGKPGRR